MTDVPMNRRGRQKDYPMSKHPMQPFVMDGKIVRFKRNAIIDWMFNNGHIDLNQIARMGFDDDDRVQLAQLLGYSLCGFHELSYVSDKVAKVASRAAREQLKRGDIGGCRDKGCKIRCGVE